MRQAETKTKEQQKELKRKVLVDSTHWTLQPQTTTDTLSEIAVTENQVEPSSSTQSSVGFSDLYEESSVTVGRRGYGKKPEPVEDENVSDDDEDESEKEEEDTTGKRKHSSSEDEYDERKRRRQEKSDYNILRKFKSISGSSSINSIKKVKR